MLKDGRIYFAAGIWPFEGIFVYALDAETGEVIWLNDRSGSLFLGHPHGAWSFGGPSLQGYLVINGKDLLVPNGTGGAPAFFDIETGQLQAFFHLANRVPGSWFVIGDPNGQLFVDPNYNRELHEDRFYETKWSNQNPWVRSQKLELWSGRTWLTRAGSRHSVSVDGKAYDFGSGFPEVEGKVCSILAGDGKLFIVTEEGCLYCFGDNAGTLKEYEAKRLPLQTRQDVCSDESKRIRRITGKNSGYALIWGIGTGRLIEELLVQSQLYVIAVDADAKKVDKLRRRWDAAGLYGKRVVVHASVPKDFEFPPYLADLIVSGDLESGDFYKNKTNVAKMFAALRPYGGTICLSIPSSRIKGYSKWIHQANLANAELEQVGKYTLLKRQGALPGSSNYVGNWSSPDELVKAPLGVLWYDDSVRQFKRSPQPKIVDGVMVSQPKAWQTTKRPYLLEEPMFADVYTGRVLTKEEALATLKDIPKKDSDPQPVQYRQFPVAKDKLWAGREDNTWGNRINPITDLQEPREIPKSYGCEPGVDYGHLITMRSGTGAFYDKRSESGLVNISGIRTGCTNSIIPANGILNVPYFYEGCTCGYPLASGLGMVSMPEEFEQWMTWGDTEMRGRIKRLGINFGAPGDRITETGTLWLDYPSVGGPSPELPLNVTPDNSTYYYHHSLWVHGSEGWPWVVASGVEGAEKISLDLLSKDYEGADIDKMISYTVRLYFAESEKIKTNARVFSVRLQGKKVLRDFDVVKTANGRMRGIVKEFKGIMLGRTLELEFTAKSGVSILSGLEILHETP